MRQYFPLLKKVALFQGIDEHELEALLKCLSAGVRRYEKEAVIFLSGAPADAVGMVCSGMVHVVKEDLMGNRALLSAVGQGELFAEAFACAHTTHLPVSVVAATPCEIMLINYRKIIMACPSPCGFHRRLIENMLTIVASKNVELNHKLEILSRRTTREKLLSYLTGQAQRAGSLRLTIPFNRQELADFLCVERSAMSAEISKMQREGLIRTHRQEFELIAHSEELEGLRPGGRRASGRP